nr:MAG TPA: mHsp60, mHsp10, Mitochondrial, Chaperonin, Complex, Symmetric [Bacteriophage sp.]
MKRLTNSDKEIPTLVDNAEYWLQVYFKLKDYENLEEQGRLIKLPCKVGDTVYVNGVRGCGEAEKYRVIRVDYHSTLGTGRNEFYIEALLCADPDSVITFYDKQFGKTVFLTKFEAEAKLKELRGNQNGKV